MVKKHNNGLFSVEVHNGISIITGKAGIEALEEVIRNKFKEENMENRIDIELIDLKNQKVLEGKGFIELRNKTFRYKGYLLSEQPKNTEDPSLGTKEVQDEWDCFLRRDDIVAVDLMLSSPEEFDQYWRVTVSCSGRYDDIDIYFKFEEKSKAIKFQQNILKWIFGEEY